MDIVINSIESCGEIKKTETREFLCTDGIYEIIVDVEKSCFSRVVLTVGILVRTEKIIRTEVFGKSRFNNAFNCYGCERKIRNRAVI